jgi:uncharacterized membrane protein YedE/YeeE
MKLALTNRGAFAQWGRSDVRVRVNPEAAGSVNVFFQWSGSMKKLLRTLVVGLMFGLGIAMFAGCSGRNTMRPGSQYVCQDCGDTFQAAGNCPACNVPTVKPGSKAGK